MRLWEHCRRFTRLDFCRSCLRLITSRNTAVYRYHASRYFVRRYIIVSHFLIPRTPTADKWSRTRAGPSMLIQLAFLKAGCMIEKKTHASWLLFHDKNLMRKGCVINFSFFTYTVMKSHLSRHDESSWLKWLFITVYVKNEKSWNCLNFEKKRITSEKSTLSCYVHY